MNKTTDFTKCEDCKKFTEYLTDDTWQCIFSSCVHHTSNGDYFEPRE